MPKNPSDETYQELSRRLDETMAKLQDPDVAIDDAADYYEQAMKLIEKLEKHLDTAENKIREIKAQFAGE